MKLQVSGKWGALGLICVMLLTGCASAVPRQPEGIEAPASATAKTAELESNGKQRFIKPQVRLVEEKPTTLAHGFRYRALSVRDFAATNPGAAFASHKTYLGAASCIELRTTPDSRVAAFKINTDVGTRYRAKIDRLALAAYFVPSCAWWNPELTRSEVDYVLQHEQIHFALSEIVAEELNSQILKTKDDIWAEGETSREAFDALRTTTDKFFQEAVKRLEAVHRDFDSGTSGIFVPAVQQNWMDRVKARLRELRA